MSQYITKIKLSGLQKMKKLLQEKEQLITSLQEENDLFRNIIKHLPFNLYWKSTDGKYLGCNDNTIEQLGLSSQDEFVGKYTSDLVDTKLAKRLDETDEAVLASGKEYILEEHGMLHMQPVVYLSSKVPLYNKKGAPIALLGLSIDITQRKKMEQELKIAKEKAEASDQAKSQFIAVMNHELSTPLASIIGLLSFLKQNLSPDENTKIIDTIENCTHHLMGLVNQVLDFSKFEMGSSYVNNSFLSLSSIIQEVQNLLKINAKNKGLEIQSKFDENIGEAIYTDKQALLQILINLVNNAIKFTDKGKVLIEVKLLERKPKTITLEIAITDTGCGIPADKLDLIFEPFQQLNDAYTRQSSRFGTGLGLAIVKKLCERLGMTITVTSKEGQGSTFFLKGEFRTGSLNYITEIRPDITNENLSQKIGIKALNLMLAAKKMRVLLVEDDNVIQYVHKKMLEQFKCQVDIAANGHDAIKALNDNHDIVFVDVSLPDISGFDVIKQIRVQKNKKLPIVALTVHTGKKERQACLDAGADKFVCKPVTQNQLGKILVHFLMKS